MVKTTAANGQSVLPSPVSLKLPLTFNWEQVLGTKGAGLSDTYDQSASDALYQDHPSAAPPASPEDPGDEVVRLPFDES